ncbi:MFS transporter [Actinocatenispora sera]|uniref:MFS transporter n=1 Tax=Actinocatenispora sera TaxID=390989 RepID=UPI0033E1E2CE
MSELPEATAVPTPITRATWAAASVMALGGFLANMDGSIVAVGLQHMQDSLGVGLAEIQWVATAYLLGLSAGLPFTPWLAQRLGAGRLWLWALSGFVVTSTLCALAPTAPALIAVRALQGVTAGILVVAGQTLIGEVVGPARLGRMMGTLGLVVGLAPIVGPSVGGLLLAWTSWPALFWLNVPIGLAAVGLGLRLVPRGAHGTPPPMDWQGAVLVSVGLPLLLYALTALAAPGGRATPAVLAAIGAGATALFIRRSARLPHPVLRIRLVVRPVTAAGLATVLSGGASMFAAVLLVPLWLQLQLGRGALSTGLLLAPMGAGTTLIMLVAGRLTDRYGGGAVASVGALIVLACTAPLPWMGAGTPMVAVQAMLVVRGVGLGLAMMPAMTAMYASVSAQELGDAAALANITMRLGGAAGGSAVVLVLAAARFHAAFLVLVGICLLAAAAAIWLRRTESTFSRRGYPA